MRLRTWSLQQARSHFNEVVAAARLKPQIVTKHGKPAVVIVAADEYERLRKWRHLKAPSLAQLLLAMPRGGDNFERFDVQMRDLDF